MCSSCHGFNAYKSCESRGLAVSEVSWGAGESLDGGRWWLVGVVAQLLPSDLDGNGVGLISGMSGC